MTTYGVEQPNKQEFKSDPGAVDGQILPVDSSKRQRVDIGGEETTKLAKDLLHTDTPGTLSVGPQFDEVSCKQSVSGLL